MAEEGYVAGSVDFWVSEEEKSPVRSQSFAFSLEVIRLYKQLESHREFVVAKQLLRSGTSIGANVEEAIAAQSKKDFVSKMSIASKEARESNYWLRLLRDTDLLKDVDINPVLKASEEIIRIITSIVKTSNSNHRIKSKK